MIGFGETSVSGGESFMGDSEARMARLSHRVVAINRFILTTDDSEIQEQLYASEVSCLSKRERTQMCVVACGR